jgi:hypothetical protein
MSTFRSSPGSIPTVCALLAGAVVVSTPGGASADTIPFSSLPVVPVPAASTSSSHPSQALPATIPATEKVDGIFIALQPEKQRKPVEDKQGYHYVNIFTTQKAATTYATDGSYSVSYPDDRNAPRVCLMAGGRSLSQRISTLFRIRPYVPPPPSAATIARLKQLHRWPPPPPKPVKATTPPHDDMQRVTLEKVTVTGDTAKVDTTDALVDLKTLGAHMLSSTSTTMSRVASGPNGMGIFASRDDKGRVQFLVTSPDLPAPEVDGDRQRELDRLSGTADRVMADLPSGVSSESGCGHVRFTMDAIKPGSGEMATILSTAFLPKSIDPDDNATDDDSSQNDSVDDDDPNAAQMRQAMDNMRTRFQRARPVAVNLSLSQLASEPAPQLSVSFGWAGKDQQLSF